MYINASCPSGFPRSLTRIEPHSSRAPTPVLSPSIDSAIESTLRAPTESSRCIRIIGWEVTVMAGIRESVELARKYLGEDPEEARYTDSKATARRESGLTVNVE